MTSQFTIHNLKFRNNKGFTLIELLVVISIIGILVALSIFGLNGAKESARDAKRKADLEQVRSGLEIFKADCNVYPGNGSGNGNLDLTSGTGTLVGNNSTSSCLSTNTYLTIPADPVSSYHYRYRRTSDSTYYVCAYLEGGSGTVNCGGGCGANSCNYRLSQP